MKKKYVYVTAANGMEVRIPAEKYPAWKAEQNRIQRGDTPSIQPETREQLSSLMEGKK